LALAQLHRAMVPGAPLALTMKRGDYSGHQLPGDSFPGRFFAAWEPDPLLEVVRGAGFAVTGHTSDEDWIGVRGTRLRTLPDFVGPGMRMLVCGLNPSLRAADMGVGFAGPTNRFWPAAVEAGVVTRPRDPWDALRSHAVGMTDLVKRATVGAAELRTAEYRDGATRVQRIVEWLEPGVVCFVGLAGYRAAVDRIARPGLQSHAFGGAPTYVMPSTSGLNARTSRAELVGHLLAAMALAR
jgi:TDG/mug DNA glycosylase family protein